MATWPRIVERRRKENVRKKKQKNKEKKDMRSGQKYQKNGKVI